MAARRPHRYATLDVQLRVIPTFARESIPNKVCLCMAYYVQRRQIDQCLETFDQYKKENQIA